MRIIQLFLVIIVTLLFLINLRCSFDEFGKWRKSIYAEKNYLQDIADLKEQWDQLKIEIVKLQTNPLTRERLVRQYGYSKPGEQTYHILRSDSRLLN